MSFLFSSPAQALGRKDAGTTGAQFLKVGISPRLAALGEAYGAMGDDVGSIFSNPAGLGYLSRKEAEFVHAQLIADITLNSIFYAHPLPEPLGNLAVNYSLIDYGKIDRTILNAPGAVNPFSTSGTFTAQDQALSLAYADKFTLWNKMFRWGMTVKILQQTIGAESANGLAYDAGVLYAPQQRSWRVGATIQNLGFLSKFRSEADPLPLNVKLSGGASFIRDKLRLGLDVNFPIDNSPNANLGAEILPIPQVALRGGYRFDNNTTDFKGPSGGIGVTLAGISFDYAYVPFQLLGANHRFSLTARFGETTEKAINQKQLDLTVRPPPPRTIPATVAAMPARSTPPPATSRPVPAPARAEPAHAFEPAHTSAREQDHPVTRSMPAGVIVGGVHATPFVCTNGSSADAWIADATADVLSKEWAKKGILNPASSYVVNGECQVSGSTLRLSARLILSGKVIGSFESSSNVDNPFDAWADLTSAIDGRLASLGVK